MEKGDKKNNFQKDPSNKPDANPIPQKKAKYTKRNWNDYLGKYEDLKGEINIKKKKTSKDKIEYILNLMGLEKNDNSTQEKNNDAITQEDNAKEDTTKTEDKLKENQENNDLMNKEPQKDYLYENLEEISSDEDKQSIEKEKETEERKNLNDIKKMKENKIIEKDNQTEIFNQKNIKKEEDLLLPNSNIIQEKYIKNNKLDSFIFDGKLFKRHTKLSNYIRKDYIKRNIYKCEYNRHEEKLRQQLKKKAFCNATIEYILPGQTVKSMYIFIEDHSQECKNFFIKIDNIDKTDKTERFSKENFIYECENIMNNSDIYDRNLFKDKFKELYN